MAMTIEEAQAALDEAIATREAAVTTKEKIAAGKEVAAAQRNLTAAKNAARKEERAAAEATAAAKAEAEAKAKEAERIAAEAAAKAEAEAKAKAEADGPKTGQEMAAQLKGVRPIIGPGESPDVIGDAGFSGYVDYKPIDEAGLRALYGYNPKTGKAYTPEEIKAANAGYLYGEDQGGPVGYEIDPRTGQMNVLYKSGMVATTGARYQMSSAGFVIPQKESLPPGVASDEYGKYYEPGQRMPGESTAAYIQRLSALGPGVLFEGGKTYQYDASGKFYIEGESSPPAGFGITYPIDGGVVNLPYTGGASTVNLPYTGGMDVRNLATGNVSTGKNPYQPGTTQYDKFEERRSAFDILYNEFDAMGLGSLVKPLEKLIIQDVGAQQFAIELRASDEYKARFAANEERTKKGLRVLTPREYLTVEDSYRQTLRAYGLKQFDNDQYVRQFIANDISAAELSDRVATAVQRVQNADPAISRTLRDYYGITNNDLVAYVLDPNQQLQKIQRQVAAAEIGAAARKQGLEAGVAVSEQLAAQGITEAQAQKGYATIADILPTAEKLSQIYGTTLEGYDQAQAEQEVFNTLASAQRRRQRLVSREVAEFSGQAGVGRGSLGTATGGQY